jgi:cell division protein FtsZ
LYDDSQKPKTEKRILHFEPDTPVHRVQPAPIEQPAAPEVIFTDTTPVPYQIEPEPENPENSRTFEFVVDHPEPETVAEHPETIVHTFFPGNNEEATRPQIKPEPLPVAASHHHTEPDLDEFQIKKSGERVVRLRQLSEKLKTHVPIEQNLQEIENVPAYMRRNVELRDVPPSSETHISAFNLTKDPENPVENKNNNAFLNPITD